jgi:hypothetical protein
LLGSGHSTASAVAIAPVVAPVKAAANAETELALKLHTS